MINKDNSREILNFTTKSVGSFPTKVDVSKRLKSKAWKCSTCGKKYINFKPITNPAPCKDCGGIFFTAVEEKTEITLQSENARMREALEKIAKGCREVSKCTDGLHLCSLNKKYCEAFIAKQALSPKEDN